MSLFDVGARALVVSEKFKNQTAIHRHRWIYKLVDEEFKKGLHALTLKALTPEEYSKESSL